MNPRSYCYVGPEEIRERTVGNSQRTHLASMADLLRWLSDAEPNPRRRDYIPATFIVDLHTQLWIADRRSEHVACALGGNVLAAGELVFSQTGNKAGIIEATNQSTGYCPEPECWQFVAAALDSAGLPHPEGFTTKFHFRRCEDCGSTNIIKNDVFECAVCGTTLSAEWNFATAI